MPRRMSQQRHADATRIGIGPAAERISPERNDTSLYGDGRQTIHDVDYRSISGIAAAIAAGCMRLRHRITRDADNH